MFILIELNRAWSNLVLLCRWFKILMLGDILLSLRRYSKFPNSKQPKKGYKKHGRMRTMVYVSCKTCDSARVMSCKWRIVNGKRESDTDLRRRAWRSFFMRNVSDGFGNWWILWTYAMAETKDVIVVAWYFLLLQTVMNCASWVVQWWWIICWMKKAVML